MRFPTFYTNSLILVVFLVCSSQASSAPVHKRGRTEFAFSVDASGFYGFTDKYDVFFGVPVSSINHAAAGGRVGIEGVNHDQFGFRLLAGYQHVFYSDIGISEITKNHLTADLFFEYFFFKIVEKYDPYVFLGPSILFSKSGKQGYATVGGGVRRFINDSWSWRLEPAVGTDFSGVRFQLSLGVSHHF